MGISSFVAGLGLLAFPYINSLVRRKTANTLIVQTCFHQGAINKIIPLLIMGTFSCLGGIVSTSFIDLGIDL